MVVALALLLAAAAPCKAQGPLRVYVESDAVAPRDTVMSARLCLTAPAGEPRVSSVSGRVTLDTAFATVLDVTRPSGSALVARDNGGGSVLLAGASAQGLHGGTLLTIRARLARPGVLPRVDVHITELNASSGQSLVTQANIAGAEPRCLGAATAVFEVLPPVASADPGEPLDLRINGCGFDAARNIVHFGELTLPNIRSTGGGTHIRVVVPKEYRASAEAAPMQIGAGTYDVSVDNGKGSSNARRVTLR